MRLFIAANPDGETRDAIIAVQERLRGRPGNVTRPENLHLTLAFLGETPEDRFPSIRGIIGDPGLSAGALRLNLRRTGCFRRGGKELWWIGPAEDDPGLDRLRALRERLAAGLEGAGIGFDRRPFTAHITLGREIRGAADRGPAPDIPFEIRRLSLMKSEHSGGLPVYTEIFGADIPGRESASVVRSGLETQGPIPGLESVS